MFLEKSDLKTKLAEYQIEAITEGDDSIVNNAIMAGIEEVRSYLLGRYDVEQIFSKTGDERNKLLLEYTKDCAIWHLISSSHSDIIYENVMTRYDRAIQFLSKAQAGKVTIDLPAAMNDKGNEITTIRGGSMPRQNYNW